MAKIIVFFLMVLTYFKLFIKKKKGLDVRREIKERKSAVQVYRAAAETEFNS